MEIRKIDHNQFNQWQSERHYLKRRIIRSKLLAHGVFVGGELVGGLLWASPHFTKKRGLFGYPGLFDKWEVLMLGRFWLEDNSSLIASEVMAESIGRAGRGNRGSKRRGWRIQQDWVIEHPPKDPKKPFVPRILISFSDTQWGHKGTIYSASGWKQWDTTNSSGQHTGRSHWIDTQVYNRPQNDDFKQSNDGQKTTWVLHLDRNPKAEKLGVRPRQLSLDLFPDISRITIYREGDHYRACIANGWWTATGKTLADAIARVKRLYWKEAGYIVLAGETERYTAGGK